MAKTSRGSSIEKYNSIFATRLRDLIENTPSATQVQLAEVIGVSRQTVSQYANGISEPGYDVLIKIANHFNVSLDYLLGRSDVKTTDINTQAVCKATGLTEKNARLLHAYVNNVENICWYDEYSYHNAPFAVELVNEFIDFAFSHPISNPDSPIKSYITFRQNYSEFQQFATKCRDMTPDESAQHTMRLYEIMEMSLREGFHPLFHDESANYFLTVFCDQYKSYLSNKYPIDSRPIPATYIASMSSEEQNGND